MRFDAKAREFRAMERRGAVVPNFAHVARTQTPLPTGNHGSSELATGQHFRGTEFDFGAARGIVRDGNQRVRGVEPDADYIHFSQIRHKGPGNFTGCGDGFKGGATASVEARSAPEGEAANNKEQEQGGGQKRGRSPVQGQLRDASHRRKDHEYAGGEDDQQPVQRAARRFGFAQKLAAVHAGFDEVRRDAVAVTLANGGFFPSRLLLAGGGRKRDRADAQHHQERAADDFEVDGRTAAVQFAEDQNPPQQAPKLIRIGKRNAAANAYVLCGKLLEDVTNHPDETAEYQPENNAARAEQFLPQGSQSQRADGEERHHAEFAEGKESDKRKRIHAGQVGFAVRDVHGAPKNPGAECSPDSVQGMCGGAVSRRRRDCQERGTGAHHQRSAQNASET